MTYNCFAITAPGLEVVTRNEVIRLGLNLLDSGIDNLHDHESGGISFAASLIDIYRANLMLRTSTRIVVRVGSFPAEGFTDLAKGVINIPWEQYLHPGQPVSFHVTCHKSRLYHSSAVARESAQAIGVRMKRPIPIIQTTNEEYSTAQMILIRIVNNECVVSVDTSGDLLHRRGYRLQTAKAPLRETLAAGMLLGCGWEINQALMDPFCGSGTIPIEAAQISSGIPAGGNRKFAFMNWPNYSRELWNSLREKANDEVKKAKIPIFASDRDDGATEITSANAERARVRDLIQIQRMAVSNIEPPSDNGWIVTNPPYGQRITSGRDLRDLYSRFGNILREKFTGWNYAILCSDPVLFGQTQLKVDHQMNLVNGGIPVKLSIGLVT